MFTSPPHAPHTQDLEQRCYRGVHLTLCAAVGVPGVVLFAAGIPLLSAWWLWRNRARLWDEAFIALYGSLYQVRTVCTA